MRDAALHAPLTFCVLVLVVAGVGSLLPFSPVEPLLLGLSLAVPAPLLIPMAALATVVHMAGKTLLYLASRRAVPAVPARQRAGLERVRVLLSRHRGVQFGTVVVSALSGVPPFYLVTACCGMLRLPLREYLVAGAIGRGVRFGALAVAPQFLGALAGAE